LVRSKVEPGTRRAVASEWCSSPKAGRRAWTSARADCASGTGLRRKGLYFSDGTFELDWNEFIDDREPQTSLLRTPGAVVHVQVAWVDLLGALEPAWSDALTSQLCP
jgi:hypothetical protein